MDPIYWGIWPRRSLADDLASSEVLGLFNVLLYVSSYSQKLDGETYDLRPPATLPGFLSPSAFSPDLGTVMNQFFCSHRKGEAE